VSLEDGPKAYAQLTYAYATTYVYYEHELIAAIQLKSPVLGYFQHLQTNAQHNIRLFEKMLYNKMVMMQSSYIVPSMGLAVVSRANTTADKAAKLR